LKLICIVNLIIFAFLTSPLRGRLLKFFIRIQALCTWLLFWRRKIFILLISILWLWWFVKFMQWLTIHHLLIIGRLNFILWYFSFRKYLSKIIKSSLSIIIKVKPTYKIIYYIFILDLKLIFFSKFNEVLRIKSIITCQMDK
jgi:hypothetical protein